MPEPTPPPGGDWAFPPVEPAPDVLPGAEPGMDDLLGWTPEPALAPATAREAPAPEKQREWLPGPTSEPPAVPDPAPAYDPSATSPDWSTGSVAEEAPPSAGVMPVPRRHLTAAAPISPLRALAGAAVAVAGVLLGIGALLWATDAPKGSPALQQTQAQSSLLASRAPSPSPAPLPSAPPSPVAVVPAPAVTSAPPSPAAAAPKLALTVLNNSTRTGLAKRAAARYSAAGWPIKLTGSFRGRITESTVYYAPGQQASAVALQKAFPAITRVRPRFAGLPGSGLTVVVIRTYPA